MQGEIQQYGTAIHASPLDLKEPVRRLSRPDDAE